MIKENQTLIMVPRKMLEEIVKLKIMPREPHYHVIGRLIVEHKENQNKQLGGEDYATSTGNNTTDWKYPVKSDHS